MFSGVGAGVCMCRSDIYEAITWDNNSLMCSLPPHVL